MKLQQVGKVCKKHNFSADLALRNLLNSSLVDRYNEQLVVSSPKIKSLFQLTPRKMDDVLNKLQLIADYVEEASMELIA